MSAMKPTSDQETIEFIKEMVVELIKLSSNEKLEMISYLLGLTLAELEDLEDLDHGDGEGRSDDDFLQ